VRGRPPRRRNAAPVVGWAVEAVAGYAENIWPRFGAVDHPAWRVTERGGRVKPAQINARCAACRDAPGRPGELPPRSLRRCYVSRLTEDAADRLFIQQQAGHRGDTSAAIYTHVSSDLMNTHGARRPARPSTRRAATVRSGGGAQAGLPLAPAAGDGRPRHVRRHRPARAAGRTRDPVVLQPGLPAGRRTARAAQPEDPHGAAGHPGLLDDRPD
jgi:hypothetical protein